jgi:hypothetical protein
MPKSGESTTELGLHRFRCEPDLAADEPPALLDVIFGVRLLHGVSVGDTSADQLIADRRDRHSSFGRLAKPRRNRLDCFRVSAHAPP